MTLTTPSPVDGSQDMTDVSMVGFQKRFNSVLGQTKKFQGKWETVEPEGEDLEQVNRTAVLNMERDILSLVIKANSIVEGVANDEIGSHEAEAETNAVLSQLAGFEAFISDLDLAGYSPEEKEKTLKRIQEKRESIINKFHEASAGI